MFISFTDIGYYIIRNLIGATEEISLLSIDVLKPMSVLPLLMVAREFYWGILMKKRMTQYIGKGKFVNIMALTSAIILMAFMEISNPAIIGVIGMIVCEAAELIYLYCVARKNQVL